MTNKQLKEILNKYPDNMDVFLDARVTEFAFGLLNSVRSKDIYMVEQPDDDTENAPRVRCLILSEE